MPVIGEGTWELDAAPRDEAVRALRRCLDLGLVHIDTAEMYGDGAAERLVGEAIRGRRDEVFLVSKVLPQHATRDGIARSCAQSLKRLGTDVLDCYLLHWPGDVPLAETVAGFEDLVAAGHVRSWGVSNFDIGELEELSRLGVAGRVACNQVLYHLTERAIEHRVLPWCRRHGIAVVAYSPFGSGHFPHGHGPGPRALARVAKAHGATPRQVALAYLTRLEGTFAIPKAASVEHVEDNAGAQDLVLTRAEAGELDAAFELGPPPASLPML